MPLDTPKPDFDRTCIAGPFQLPVMTTTTGPDGNAVSTPSGTFQPGFWFITSRAVYDEAVVGLTAAQKAVVDGYVQQVGDAPPVGIPAWAGDTAPWAGTVFLKVPSVVVAQKALAKRYR